jgi:hypothetical protein
VDVLATRVVPTVWLVVDAAQNMQKPLSGMERTSRWDALHEVLLDPQSGIINALEYDARWGLVMSDTQASNDADAGPVVSV